MDKRAAASILIAAAIASAYAIYVLESSTVRVRVTTTTSLYATGLLDYLVDEFTKVRGGASFDIIPVGSGEALRRAELGDACLVFVHAPALEKEYIEKGVITGHRIFAYNYFIIAGPPRDPGDVRKAKDAVDAFRRIFQAGERGEALFISRGDNSGTHVKELSLWRKAGLDPRGKPWYRETGSGMGHTLLVADEKKAYVLTDIGTYLKFKKEGKILGLEILYENGGDLINIYSVYLVASCRDPERRLAAEFANFVTEDAQVLIAGYKLQEFGRPLFHPATGRLDWLKDAWSELAGR